MPTPDAPTRDADPEPQRHLGYLIRRAQQRHVAVWALVVSTETTSVQYSVLAVLDRLREASQRQLCDEIDLDRSTIADLVARMERRGLIRRQRHPADARRNTVRLTEAGADELRRLQPLVEEVQRQLAANLSPSETEDLRGILRRLLGETG